MTICKRIYYSGRVQGVGFRYTAQELAAAHAVAGYVRNLASGQVELVAEGSADDVGDFLTSLTQRMAGHVDLAEMREEPPGGHRTFMIRH